MSNPCYYHPNISAVGACIQCGTPGCADCLEAVGERMACRRCVGALKSRLVAQTAASPSAYQSPAYQSPARQYGATPDPNAGFNPNAGLNFASMPSDFVDTTPVEKLTPSRLLIGLGLASAVGILGSLGIEKILFYSHHGFPFLYMILGAAVGGALRACTGRGGLAMALTAAGVMVVCLGGSHLVYVQDMLNQAQAAGDAGVGVTFSDAFSMVMGSLKFTHWMLVLASVVICFVVAKPETKPGF